MEEATLTCPECHAKSVREMPEGKSQVMYVCDGCGKRIKAKEGKCCVFCSYGDKHCAVCTCESKEGRA